MKDDHQIDPAERTRLLTRLWRRLEVCERRYKPKEATAVRASAARELDRTVNEHMNQRGFRDLDELMDEIPFIGWR